MRPFCPECGDRLDEADRFCAACGAARKEADPAPDEGASAGAPPPSRKPMSLGRGLAIGLLTPLVWVVLIVLYFGGDGCSSAEGRFVSTGAPFGDHSVTPAACRSGQHEGYFGVALRTEAKGRDVLRLVVEPTGRKTVLFAPVDRCTEGGGCAFLPVEAEHCSTFELVVTRTSTQVNRVTLLEGHLRLACALPEGGHVEANVRFDGCD